MPNNGNPLWVPGVSGNPKGRPKGAANKVTQEIRKAYELLLYQNIPAMSEWLNQIAAENPEKAMDIIIRLSPFVFPKKQSIEAHEDFKPIQLIIPQNPKKEEDE